MPPCGEGVGVATCFCPYHNKKFLACCIKFCSQAHISWFSSSLTIYSIQKHFSILSEMFNCFHPVNISSASICASSFTLFFLLCVFPLLLCVTTAIVFPFQYSYAQYVNQSTLLQILLSITLCTSHTILWFVSTKVSNSPSRSFHALCFSA